MMEQDDVAKRIGMPIPKIEKRVLRQGFKVLAPGDFELIYGDKQFSELLEAEEKEALKTLKLKLGTTKLDNPFDQLVQ